MSTKSNKNVAVSSAKSSVPAVITTAQNASEAIKVIEQKLAQFTAVSETPYKTGGKLNLPLTGKTISLDQAKDTEDLIRAMGNLNSLESSYNQGAELLGLTKYPAFKHEGYTVANWQADLVLRYQVVSQHEVVSKLKEQITKLRKFVSEEEQFTATLQEAAEVMQSI